MLRNALADLEMARRARYDEVGQELRVFHDYLDKEGVERRKVWFAASASARSNLVEARRCFLQATMLVQHIGAEEAARWRSPTRNTAAPRRTSPRRTNQVGRASVG
jgi:hypothetical protein